MFEHTDPELRGMRSRGKRHSGDDMKGGKSYFTKLNKESVVAIRESDTSMIKLAKEHDVTRQTISNVIHRKTWRHI